MLSTSQCRPVDRAHVWRSLTCRRLCCWVLLMYTLCSRQVLAQNNNVNIIILDVRCQKLSDKLDSIECIKNNNGTSSTLTVHVLLREDVSAIVAKFSVFLLQKGDRRTKLFSANLEFCSLLTRSSRRSILRILYDSIKKVAVNFPPQCPFKKNVLYTIQDYQIYPAMFPMFLPRFNFSAFMDVYSGTEKILFYNLVGAVCNDQHYCRSLL